MYALSIECCQAGTSSYEIQANDFSRYNEGPEEATIYIKCNRKNVKLFYHHSNSKEKKLIHCVTSLSSTDKWQRKQKLVTGQIKLDIRHCYGIRHAGAGKAFTV